MLLSFSDVKHLSPRLSRQVGQTVNSLPVHVTYLLINKRNSLLHCNTKILSIINRYKCVHDKCVHDGVSLD
jgi:hypothetical protein